MLYHLDVQNAKYVVKYKIPVVEGHNPSTVAYLYKQLQRGMIKAIASLVSEANGNDPDLTNHPWALHSVWKVPGSPSIAVILEWQPASAVPRTITTGNVTPAASSSTTAFTRLRSPSVTDADETASILYVVPYVDNTWKLKIASTLPPSYVAWE